MTLRRLIAGVTVVLGLSIWSWCRGNDPAAPATGPNPVYSADAGETADGGGNHENAIYRYRTNQPHHWKHIVVGTH